MYGPFRPFFLLSRAVPLCIFVQEVEWFVRDHIAESLRVKDACRAHEDESSDFCTHLSALRARDSLSHHEDV